VDLPLDQQQRAQAMVMRPIEEIARHRSWVAHGHDAGLIRVRQARMDGRLRVDHAGSDDESKGDQE
jgi:hypothetical protein